MTRRQLSAILAGLRLLQNRLSPTPTGEDVDDILTNGGADKPLGIREINGLCYRLNRSVEKPHRGQCAVCNQPRVGETCIGLIGIPEITHTHIRALAQ